MCLEGCELYSFWEGKCPATCSEYRGLLPLGRALPPASRPVVMHLSPCLQDNVFISIGGGGETDVRSASRLGSASRRVPDRRESSGPPENGETAEVVPKVHSPPVVIRIMSRPGCTAISSLHHEAKGVCERALMVQCQRVPS